MNQQRCPWCEATPLYREYHDKEWGVPTYDAQKLFEMLCLEGAQAGLSWITVLNKRAHYREVYEKFDAKKMALYSDQKHARLLADPGIIRNRLKVNAFTTNAQAMLAMQAAADRNEGPDFASFLWSFVGGEPQLNNWASLSQVPATTAQSDAMSKALKKLGFKFVGGTICYAFMQATGMVNDHLIGCYRHAQLAKAL